MVQGMVLPLKARARHALDPFAVATESLTALDHLAARGVASLLFNKPCVKPQKYNPQ